MPRIRCHYMECIFIENGHCSADSVELDPDTGCETYSSSEDDLDDWEDDSLGGWEAEDDDENEEENFWLDDGDDP